MWQLLEAKKYDEAQAMIDRKNEVLGPWMAKSAKRSGGYRALKGPDGRTWATRSARRAPPTLPVDADEIADLQDALRTLGWLS